MERTSTINGSSINYNTGNLRLGRINRRISRLQARMNSLLRLLTKDECASNPCKHGATCQDLFNAYLCHCPPEWEVRLKHFQVPSLFLRLFLGPSVRQGRKRVRQIFRNGPRLPEWSHMRQQTGELRVSTAKCCVDFFTHFCNVDARARTAGLAYTAPEGTRIAPPGPRRSFAATVLASRKTPPSVTNASAIRWRASFV